MLIGVKLMIYYIKNKLRQILSEKENKDFEIDQIISYVTKKEKERWLIEKTITKKQIRKAIKIANKRKKNIPLQYLIKNWDFYGINFKVGKGVLIPRQDTETLVDLALPLIEKDDKILDLGTGTGCISAAIAKNKKDVKIFAVEKFFRAYIYAKKNLKPFKKKVKLFKGDILNEKFAKKFNNINIIVSNPPYISEEELEKIQKEVKFEPKTALYGGKNGLKFYENITLIWKNCLKKGGYLIFEIGESQKNSVETILKKHGFNQVKTYKDLSKKDRVIVAKK